MHLLSFYEL